MQSDPPPPEAVVATSVKDQPNPTVASVAALPRFEGRLHPFTIILTTVQALRRLILPAIPIVFFGGRTGIVALVSVLLLGAIVRAVVRYFTFVYRLEGGEIITKQGILERTERHIPLDRVQEIRIEQGLLHRLCDVGEVVIETAGGEGPEASLSVLSLSEANRLRQAVFDWRRNAGHAAGAVAGAPPDTGTSAISKLSLRDLILAGVTSNHLVQAMVIVGAVLTFVDDVLPEEAYKRIGVGIYTWATHLFERGIGTALVISAAVVLAVFVVSAIFSVAGSVILFYNFTLSRMGEDLQRSYGLVTRRSSSLPRKRIQVLEIEEGFLRRLFRLATLRADTAGNRSEERGESRAGRDVLLPVIPRDQVRGVLPSFFPDLPDAPENWRRVSKRAIARGTLTGIVFFGALAAASAWTRFDFTGPWLLLVVPLIYVVNVIRYCNLGYALGDGYFYTRRGWLSRSTHIVPIRNAQAVVVSQGPLDRRLGLASLVVDTAGQAYTGGGPRISNLPVEEAHAIAQSLARRASLIRYRW